MMIKACEGMALKPPEAIQGIRREVCLTAYYLAGWIYTNSQIILRMIQKYTVCSTTHYGSDHVKTTKRPQAHHIAKSIRPLKDTLPRHLHPRANAKLQSQNKLLLFF